METGITPEQKKQLDTWAGKRDILLSEISVLKIQEESLQRNNKSVASSNKDIADRELVIKGRIEELEKKEAKLPSLISKDVAKLESEKTLLESKIIDLKKLVLVFTEQKTSLEKDVSSALETFNIVKDETLLLDKVVNKVTTVSADNSKKIDDIVSKLAISLEEIIKVNKKNVDETNIVIEKLPAMLVEVQKKGLIKRKL